MTKLLLLLLIALPTFINAQEADPNYNYLTEINCRVGERTPDGLNIINERDLNTISKDPADFSFVTKIHDDKKITTYLQHISIAMPNDRFQAVLKLDDIVLLKVSHIDLDVYLEQTIEGHRYFLHCMPPIMLR